MTDLSDLISVCGRLLAIVYTAFLSVGIYFEINLIEPSWIIRTIELSLGFTAIAILFVESVGFLSRDRR